MKNQRSSIVSTSSQVLRKQVPTSNEPQLLGHKSRKDSPKASPKPRTGHTSPKLSNTLSKVRSGDISKPVEKEFTRGKALEVLLDEDLKGAKKLGMGSEVAAIRRVFQAVMERSPEFRGVLESIQRRYEDILDRAVKEAETAQAELRREKEEKNHLIRRIDSLVYESSLIRKPIESPKPMSVKAPRTMPSSPKGSAVPINPENTERMNAWAMVTGKSPPPRDSASNLSSCSEIEPIAKGPPKPYAKPNCVPRLHLEFLASPQHHAMSPKPHLHSSVVKTSAKLQHHATHSKGHREALIIEDM